MIVAIPKEINALETRVAATPGSIKDLIKSGMEVHVESKAGIKSFITDQDYKDAGARVIDSVTELYSKADIIINPKFLITENDFFFYKTVKCEVTGLKGTVTKVK